MAQKFSESNRKTSTAVSLDVLEFVGAMKMAINTSVWGYIPFYLIPMLFQPVIGYLAYKNGYNNKGIFYKLIYKSRDKDKRLR